jgi:uncharacterized protein with HEPN domain
MPLPEVDAIRLRHMLDAAEKAVAFTTGRSRADLDTDTQLAFAVTRALEIVGEAAANVSPEGRACCDLPWPQMVGMRHRIVHAYYDINLDRLWETVTEYLPGLVSELQQLLPPLEPTSPP